MHSKHLSNIRNLKRKIPRILPPSPGNGPVERYTHFSQNSFKVRHPRDDDNLQANVKIKLSFNFCAYLSLNLSLCFQHHWPQESALAFTLTHYNLPKVYDQFIRRSSIFFSLTIGFAKIQALVLLIGH